MPEAPVPETDVAQRSPRVPRLVVPLFLALVMSIGLFSRNYPEFYPFATWGMFSRVPSTTVYWALRIHTYRGQKVDPPQLLRDLPQYARQAYSASDFALIFDYGEAMDWYQRGDKSKARRLQTLRPMVENNVLGKGVEYELVKIEGDPREMYLGGAPDFTTSIGRYYTSGAEPQKAAKVDQLVPVLFTRSAISDEQGETANQGAFKSDVELRPVEHATADAAARGGAGARCFEVTPPSGEPRPTAVMCQVKLPVPASASRYLIACKVWSATPVPQFRVGFKTSVEQEVIWAADESGRSTFSVPAGQWTEIRAYTARAISGGEKAMLRFSNAKTTGPWRLDDARLYQVRE